MTYYGIPDKLIKMVKLLYGAFECAVLEDGEDNGCEAGMHNVWLLISIGYRLCYEKNVRKRTNRNTMELHHKIGRS